MSLKKRKFLHYNDHWTTQYLVFNYLANPNFWKVHNSERILIQCLCYDYGGNTPKLINKISINVDKYIAVIIDFFTEFSSYQVGTNQTEVFGLR